jgi:RNA polymerase sigma-70 factor, ECF subfamily
MRGEAARGPEAQAPDAEVIEQVLSGNRELYRSLVVRYQDRLYRHALGMLLDHDAAMDVVQDTLVKAYLSLRRCRQPARFGTWLFRILRNGCLDYLKDRRRQELPLDESGNFPADDSRPDTALRRLAARQALDEALARLPESLREAFLLKHVQELSYEEMSEILGVAPGALRMRVMRAREALHALLVDEGEAAASGM